MAAWQVAAPSFETLASLALRMRAEEGRWLML
jgi:hypothetical protein